MRKKILLLAAALGFAGVLAPRARAVTIEGYTPSGHFGTVGISEAGSLYVDILSTTPQHVVTDPGSVTTIVSTVPVSIVSPNPLPVTATFSGNIQVGASTATTITTGHFTCTSTAAQIIAANSSARQSLVCNSDLTVTVFVGPSGVTATSGIALLPGTCLSPDVPSSFQGALSCITASASTATGAVSWMQITP